MKGYKIRGKESEKIFRRERLFRQSHLLRKKGKGSGLHESILGGGAVLGPILGGVAAQYVGLRAPYFLCIGVLAAAIGAQYLLLKKQINHGAP